VSLEVEVLDAERAAGRPDLPEEAEIARLVALAVATAGVRDGHVAIAFVDAEQIAQLNAEHRGK
jgi:probable rRNA maturation factor